MIIGISGKIGSGKDTVGKIIQYLTSSFRYEYSYEEWYDRVVNHKSNTYSNSEIRKFADKLKDIVCLLIGCTREQLEDHEFKNKELGEEWNSIRVAVQKRDPFNMAYFYTKLFLNKEDVKEWFLNKSSDEIYINEEVIKMTPRLLLQLLGTDCGRNIIHPNIWVNSLFSEYKPKYIAEYDGREKSFKESLDKGNPVKQIYPNYIITDLRFENELKTIEDRRGITIRVNSIRIMENTNKIIGIHPSETALDNAHFTYIIDNNGTIEELIEKVKDILIYEKVINVSN